MWYVNLYVNFISVLILESFILTMWYVNTLEFFSICFNTVFYINYVVCK